jgi:cytochrome c
MRLARPFELALLSIIALCAWQQPVRAEGDAVSGKKAYLRSCAACHGHATAAAGPGPSLAGLFGRRAGTVNGTPYGKNLYEANIVWDEASLQRYLASPTDAVHGTIMPIGIHEPTERADVIAYLKTLKRP